MASIKAILKIYDRLGVLHDRGARMKVTAVILKDATELSIPTYTEFMRASTELAEKIGHFPVAELHEELNKLMHDNA